MVCIGVNISATVHAGGLLGSCANLFFVLYVCMCLDTKDLVSKRTALGTQ
jgi:hypothetical protein